MNTKLDLKEIERRAHYAAFQDGLMEIFMGVFLILFGGALVTEPLLALFLAVGAVLAANRLIERIKVRFIYPRAGYVKLPQDPKSTGKGIAIATVIMVVILLGAMGIAITVLGLEGGTGFFQRYILPPVTGFFLAIGPYWLGQVYGITRGYVWAALFLLGGLAMPGFSIAAGYKAVSLLCTVVGSVTLLTGAYLFLQFVRNNPPAPINTQERPNA